MSTDLGKESQEFNKGRWTDQEDAMLMDYVYRKGAANWAVVAQQSGLKRKAGACRHRWQGKLRDTLRTDCLTDDEMKIIMDNQEELENDTQQIVKLLPGRVKSQVAEFLKQTAEPGLQPADQDESMDSKIATTQCASEIDGYNKGRWTDQEDAMLMDYVFRKGAANWAVVAQQSGLKRKASACRHCWQGKLRDTLRTDCLTDDEKKIILENQEEMENDTQQIAKLLPGRAKSQVAEFLKQTKEPGLQPADQDESMDSKIATTQCASEIDGYNKGRWTDQEDAMLMDYVFRKGAANWVVVAQQSGLKRKAGACRHRWQGKLRDMLRTDCLTDDEKKIILENQEEMENDTQQIVKLLPGRVKSQVTEFLKQTEESGLQPVDQDTEIPVPDKLTDEQLKEP